MLVVKIGGSKNIRYDLLADELAAQSRELVLVHGGSDELNQVSEKLGHPPRFVTTRSGHQSRYTDLETMRIFEMVYCGKQNKLLVELLQSRGVNAIGLSGLDGRLLVASRKESLKVVEDGKVKILRGDYSGTVQQVNTALLRLLLENGYVPVVTPPAISEAGEPLNVDGDRASAMIAAAMKAEALLILSTVPGLLRDLGDPSSLVREIRADNMAEFENFAKDRMKKKLMGAKEALEMGIPKVVLATANREKPLAAALAGEGTSIF